MGQLLLGLDVGSSSVKAALIDADTGKRLASAQSPADEMPMLALKQGWAEQDPNMWWHHAKICIRKCIDAISSGSKDITAIGISYQMHGLVLVDETHKPLRPSIIWCDSRAVGYGDKAFKDLGSEYCLDHFLNSPGNFTAAKLKWVKENEPDLYDRIHKVMLPGDYIALCLTGDILTTDAGLSEGMFWDYQTNSLSERLLSYFNFSKQLIPEVRPVFSNQGTVRKEIANELGLPQGVKVTYRAGDQPNNALSLNVLNTGETAATAGTSGVIYTVTDKNVFDRLSRVNTFIHVNNTSTKKSNGVLLCVNGTGILNQWVRRQFGNQNLSYDQMNSEASGIAIGADDLHVLPFGNGAERILSNKTVGASFYGLDFNRHTQANIFRAAQEGIAFSLNYGFEILQAISLHTNIIRAGNSNMFLSSVFKEAFTNTIGVPLEILNTDGATGAALGAGIGAGIFDNNGDVFKGLEVVDAYEPDPEKQTQYQEHYEKWKALLLKFLEWTDLTT